MILRSLAEAIRNQDWVTVTIEFLVVVVGIFVGLRVGDWSKGRNDRALEQEYRGRLLADTQWNIDNFRELESVFESKAAFITTLRDTSATELLSTAPASTCRGHIS